jgi:hypothetical protein
MQLAKKYHLLDAVSFSKYLIKEFSLRIKSNDNIHRFQSLFVKEA